MSKEHLVWVDATDTDDLIDRLHDLNNRIDGVMDDLFNAKDDADLKALYQRQGRRLTAKKYELLAALKQSLEGLTP